MSSTCGILKGMCGLWNPTAKKNGWPWCAWLFSRLMASSVLSRSGSVPPGCSVTFTAHSKLAWSRPSSPLHIWKQRLNTIYLQHLFNDSEIIYFWIANGWRDGEEAMSASSPVYTQISFRMIKKPFLWSLFFLLCINKNLPNNTGQNVCTCHTRQG